MDGINVLLLGNNLFPFHKLSIAGPLISETLEHAGVNVTVTEDLNMLKKENLSKFNVFVCYYTLGKLTGEQLNVLLDFVSSGKGFVGLHSAADSFRENYAYLSMLGGIFRTHPAHQVFHIEVSDKNHPITKGVSDFGIYDELYILYHDPKRYHLLLHCTWEGDKQPVAWIREHGKGRVLYLSLGHTEEALKNEKFQRLLTEGVKWASGQIG